MNQNTTQKRIMIQKHKKKQKTNNAICKIIKTNKSNEAKEAGWARNWAELLKQKNADATGFLQYLALSKQLSEQAQLDARRLAEVNAQRAAFAAEDELTVALKENADRLAPQAASPHRPWLALV